MNSTIVLLQKNPFAKKETCLCELFASMGVKRLMYLSVECWGVSASWPNTLLASGAGQTSVAKRAHEPKWCHPKKVTGPVEEKCIF